MSLKQSRSPQQVSEHVWYYEDGRKLLFVVESAHFEKNTIAQTLQFKVPLSMLEKSLTRSPKKGQRR